MSVVIVLDSGWQQKVMCDVMQIESLCVELQDAWQDLQDQAQDRSRKLDLSLKAQQFFFEAGEVESWLSEKNDVLSSTDYGHDRDAASKLLTKHKVCCACSVL
jgi:spectrin beta